MVGAVETDHLAEAVVEVVGVGVGEVVQLVLAGVHAAGGDGVEEGFPEVGAGAFDQGDVGAGAEAVAGLGRELQAGGTATDDDDSVRGRAVWGRVRHEASSRLTLPHFGAEATGLAARPDG